MRVRLALLALLALVAATPADAAEPCGGEARAGTTSTGSTGCGAGSPGDAPHLAWTSSILCVDGRGGVYHQLPDVHATVTGACASASRPACVPFLDEPAENAGLRSITLARDQRRGDGCHFAATRWTDGRCPRAAGCATAGGAGAAGEPRAAPPAPVAVGLGGRPPELTSAREGMTFDLNGDGTPDPAAWTRPDAEAAFLALDRDGSGGIESGLELFTAATPQLPSATPSGDRALALFDEPQNGGDGDGWIGPSDAIFEHLLLWWDRDNDGVTDEGELVLARDAGLEGIAIGAPAAETRWRNGERSAAWPPSRLASTDPP